jgi:hypothetical protein
MFINITVVTFILKLELQRDDVTQKHSIIKVTSGQRKKNSAVNCSKCTMIKYLIIR